MFLSKKLLIDTWVPIVEEKWSSKASGAASSTWQMTVPVFVGTNKIFYHSGTYNTRSVQIEDCANTQTDIINSTFPLFAEGDSSASAYTYYSNKQTSDNITFAKLVIDVPTEVCTPTTYVKTWAKTLATMHTMFGDTIIWSNSTTSSSVLYANTTTLKSISSAGGFGYVGKPDSSHVLVSRGNDVYTATSSAASVLFTKSITGSVKYVDGRYYIMLYSPTLTLVKLSSAGVIEWQKGYYADEENTVPITIRFLGYTNGKLYGVSFPTSVDSTSRYYKLVLLEIDMDTGDVLHTYDMPTPRAVTEGVIPLSDSIAHSMGNFNFGVQAINRRFALPILAGHTKNSIFYHDWFIITVPE